MKAFVITEPGRAEFRDVPEPRVGPEDVLLQVAYVGLCGSDLRTWRGRNPLVSYPRIPGHEVSGVVLATGSDVPETVRKGTRATVSPCVHCGACSACRGGRENACRDLRVLGVQRDGALTERVAVHHAKVFPSATLSLEALAFAEPLTIAYHAVARGRITASDTVVVLGCGGIGTGVVTAAVARGARVIAVDLLRDKVDLAEAVGAAHGIDAATEDVVARVAQLTDGTGADVVVEAAGEPEAFRQAVELVCYAGRVVYVGYCKGAVTFDTTQFVRKELDILGARNAFAADFRPAVALLAARRFPVDAMITRIFPFAETDEALRYWDRHQAEVRRLLVRVGA